MVQIDDSNEWIKLGDNKIQLDVSFEPEKHAQTVGTVIMTDGTDYHSDTLIDGTEVRHHSMVQNGDRVIFHFLCVKDAMSNARLFVEDGKKILFIRYEELYVVIRHQQSGFHAEKIMELYKQTGELIYENLDTYVIPINGWILVEPKEEEQPKTKFTLPDMVKGKKSVNKGVVRFCSDPGMYYDKSNLTGLDPDIKTGDEVVFSPSDAIPIQYEFHSELGMLYRMKRKDAYKVDKETMQVA